MMAIYFLYEQYQALYYQWFLEIFFLRERNGKNLSVSNLIRDVLLLNTYIFVTFINPEYLENIIKIAEQEILNSDPEISDEDLDLALSMTQKMLQPQWMSTLSVLGGTFMGFFYSLIISFFMKKDDPNFIV